MTPTSLATAVVPRTVRNRVSNVRIYVDEKRTFLKGAWLLKG